MYNPEKQAECIVSGLKPMFAIEVKIMLKNIKRLNRHHLKGNYKHIWKTGRKENVLCSRNKRYNRRAQITSF